MFDPKKLAAEFVGTAILVFIAVGVATENFGFKLFGSSMAAGVVTTAFAFGLVLMALAYAIGPISGCPREPGRDPGLRGRRPHEAHRGRRLHGSPGGRRHRRGPLLWAGLPDVPGYSRKVQGLGTDGYGARLPRPSEPERRLHHRGGAHLRVRHRDPLRHPQGRHPGRGRVGHRHGPGRGPPDRHPPHRHLGQPGAEPRPGPDRRGAAPSARSGCSCWPPWSGPSSPPSCTWSSPGARMSPWSPRRRAPTV